MYKETSFVTLNNWTMKQMCKINFNAQTISIINFIYAIVW